MDPRYPTYHSMTNGVGETAAEEEQEEEEDDDEPEERDSAGHHPAAGSSDEDGEGEEEEEVEEYLDEGRPDDTADLARRAAALPAGLQPVYRVLKILMSPENHVHNWPFMNAVDSKSSTLWDYDSVVKTPIWLKKVREKLLQQQYDTPTAVFVDLRQMLRNCYCYNGPQHSVTRRALRLEQIMEQLIEQLEPELRQRCTLEATEGPDAVVDAKIVNRRRSVRNKTPGFFSHVLHWVRHERADREKEFRRQQLEAKRQQRQEKENTIVAWEARLLQGDTGERLRAMWELPQLAQFVHLSLRALNIFEVPLYEMERMLLVPQSSETLAMLMTSLVSAPLIRTKLGELPPMPYTMWMEKLAARVQLWYRAYAKEAGRTERLHDTQGIEPEFWHVVGTTNPFETRLFHQLSFYQRVWMVKTMCDFLFHNHKTVQECVMEASLSEPRENVLGVDRHGFEYIHLPHLFVQDVRLYRRRSWRAPDEWRRTEPEPPPAAPPPLRAAELGSRWSRARLEKFRRRLTQLRRSAEQKGGTRRPAAARRTFTCLGGVATPAGSATNTEDEDGSEEDEDSSADGAADEGPEFTLTRSGRRSQRPRSAARKGAAAAAPAAAPAAPAAAETPSRRGRGRGRGKGRGGGSSRASSRASTPAKQTPTPQVTDQNVCPYCGMSSRTERARKAHRCLQEQASAVPPAADSVSASEVSDSSNTPESDSLPPTPRAGRGRGRRSRGRPSTAAAPAPAPAAEPSPSPSRGGRRGPGRPPRGRRRSTRSRPPALQPEEEVSRASTADRESLSGAEDSRLSAPELESVVSGGDELSRLSAGSGADELPQLSPPRLAPVSPDRRPRSSDAEDARSAGEDKDNSRMEVDGDTATGEQDGAKKGAVSPSGALDGNSASCDGEGAPPRVEDGSKASTPETEPGTAQHESGAPAPTRDQQPSDMEVDSERPVTRAAQNSSPVDRRGAAGDGAVNSEISAPVSGAGTVRTAGDSGRLSPAVGGGSAGVEGEKPISGQTAGVANGLTVNGEVRDAEQNGVVSDGGGDVARVKQESGRSAAGRQPSGPDTESSQARVKLELSEEAMDGMDIKMASAEEDGDSVEQRLDGGKLKDFKGVVDGVKQDSAEQKPVPEDKKPDTATADAKPVAIKPDPDQADLASVKPEPASASGAGVKSEPGPRGATRADSAADSSEESDGDGTAGPELAVPELVPEPDHLAPPDPDQFQLVASTFDGLRRLVDTFDPDAETQGKKKGQKQPACEVELHKALKKILKELEPLETKINQSVRRMRKRLCQEWLNYIERPADFVDPNEAAWVEPDQEPEPASKAADKSPSPSPEPSDEEELMDADGRRRQRSRRAKRKRVNYCVDGGSGAAAGDGRDTDAWQMSSRGRMRKVRKMDDFAYEEAEENSRDHAQPDDDFQPGDDPLALATSPSKGARAARPPAGAVGTSTDRGLPGDWETYRQRMLQREQVRRIKPAPPTPRPARITEPSPAWNSELSILNENLGDRVSRIRSQIQQKIARRPPVYRPRPETPGPQRAVVPAISSSVAGPRPPLGQRVLVNRANLVGGALTKVVHMSGNSSPFVLRVGPDGRMFMDKVSPASTPASSAAPVASTAPSLPAAASVDAGAAGTPSRPGGLIGIDSAEAFGDIRSSPVKPGVPGSPQRTGLTASPAKVGVTASPLKVEPASGAGPSAAATVAAGVSPAGTAQRGPPPGSKVAVVLPYKDPATGNTMYMQLPPDQANSILQSLNLPGLAASSGATSVSTFTAAVTVAAAAPQLGAPVAVSGSGVRFTPGLAAATVARCAVPVPVTGGVVVPTATGSALAPALAPVSALAAVPATAAPIRTQVPAPPPPPVPVPIPARVPASTTAAALVPTQAPTPPAAPAAAPVHAPAPSAPVLSPTPASAPAPTLVPAPTLSSPAAAVSAGAVVHPPHRSVLLQHVQSLPIAPGGSRPTLQEPPPPPPAVSAPAAGALSSDIAARVKTALQQAQARGAPLDKQQAQRLAGRVLSEQRARPPPPPYSQAVTTPILQQQLCGGSPRKPQPIRPMPPGTVSRPARPALVAAGQPLGRVSVAGQARLVAPGQTLVAGQTALLASPQRTLVAGQQAVLTTTPPTLIARAQPTLLASPLTSSPPTLLAVNSQPALLTSSHATVLTSTQQPTFLASAPALLTSSRATLLTGSPAATLLTSPAPLIGSSPALLTAGPSLAVTAPPARPPPPPGRTAPQSAPAPGPPPMQRAPRYVSTSVQFVASGGAPAAAVPGPRLATAQQGKVVIIKSGAEQKLGVLMPNGQIVELSEKQANSVKLEALKRGRPDASPS